VAKEVAEAAEVEVKVVEAIRAAAITITTIAADRTRGIRTTSRTRTSR
jgi:hypothetical protein